jgi:hypothetical protein
MPPRSHDLDQFTSFTTFLDASVVTIDESLATGYVAALRTLCRIALQPYDQNPTTECE